MGDGNRSGPQEGTGNEQATRTSAQMSSTTECVPGESREYRSPYLQGLIDVPSLNLTIHQDPCSEVCVCGGGGVHPSVCQSLHTLSHLSPFDNWVGRCVLEVFVLLWGKNYTLEGRSTDLTRMRPRFYLKHHRIPEVPSEMVLVAIQPAQLGYRLVPASLCSS